MVQGDSRTLKGTTAESKPRSWARRLSNPNVLVALISALGGVTVAVVTGIFTVLAGWVQLGPDPGSIPVAAPTVTVTQTVTAPAPVVSAGETNPPVDETTEPGDVTTPDGSLYLSELRPIDEEGNWRDGEVNLEGQAYAQGMLTSAHVCESYRTYDLGRHDYQRFDSVVAFSDTTSDTESAGLGVYLDGVPVHEETIVRGEPLPVDVDVSNAKQLHLYFDLSCSPGVVVGLGDPKLIP